MKMKEITWTKEYHTPTVGTTYTIKTDGTYITLKAHEKPYRITAAITSLKQLLQ